MRTACCLEQVYGLHENLFAWLLDWVGGVTTTASLTPLNRASKGILDNSIGRPRGPNANGWSDSLAALTQVIHWSGDSADGVCSGS